jgi:prepilin-type N-terminal cleavage/methylation domain-containing protein
MCIWPSKTGRGHSLDSLIARLSRDERGFTLIELLITSVLAVIIIGVSLALLDTATAQLGPKEQERSIALREAQVGVYQLARDARSGYYPTTNYTPPTGATNSLELIIDRRKSDGTYELRRYRWACNVVSGTTPRPGSSTAFYHKCVRYWSTNLNASPTTNPQVVVDRLVANATNCGVPLISDATELPILGNDENDAHATCPVFRPDAVSPPDYYDVYIEVTGKGSRKTGYARDIVLKDGFFLRNASTQ